MSNINNILTSWNFKVSNYSSDPIIGSLTLKARVNILNLRSFPSRNFKIVLIYFKRNEDNALKLNNEPFPSQDYCNDKIRCYKVVLNSLPAIKRTCWILWPWTLEGHERRFLLGSKMIESVTKRPTKPVTFCPTVENQQPKASKPKGKPPKTRRYLKRKRK